MHVETFYSPSFKITREQQSRIENFIDIGDKGRTPPN